jgi:hypothetical protein
MQNRPVNGVRQQKIWRPSTGLFCWIEICPLQIHYPRLSSSLGLPPIGSRLPIQFGLWGAGFATRCIPEAKYPGSGSGSGYFEVPGYLLIQRRALYAGTRYLLKRAIRPYLPTWYLPEYLSRNLLTTPYLLDDPTVTGSWEGSLWPHESRVLTSETSWNLKGMFPQHAFCIDWYGSLRITISNESFYDVNLRLKSHTEPWQQGLTH